MSEEEYIQEPEGDQSEQMEEIPADQPEVVPVEAEEEQTLDVVEEEAPAEPLPAPSNSGLAIVSLIFGILGVTLLPLLGSIVAVITGPMAKREIQESDGMVTGEEMAKVGQILGWVGIVLFGVVACCCIIFLIIPLAVGLGWIVDSSYYYWLAPGLAGLLF